MTQETLELVTQLLELKKSYELKLTLLLITLILHPSGAVYVLPLTYTLFIIISFHKKLLFLPIYQLLNFP